MCKNQDGANVFVCIKISKYNDKLIRYTNKIEHTKHKIEQILLKKKDYIDNLKILESIPTLQLGILENNDDTNTEGYVNVKNEIIDNEDNISEVYSENFSNNSAKNEDT